MAAKTLIGAALKRAEGVDRVVGARVTGRYFDVFGVQPALGRVFGREEDAQGQKVVVLSHRLWTRQFGANRAVLGTTVGLNQQPHTVIGIMPASFDFTAHGEELWIPMAFTPQERDNAGSHFLSVYARLRDDISLQAAATQMPVIIQRRVSQWSDESADRTILVRPLMDQFVGFYRERLVVLFAAATLVLLIACGNVSNLLLARSTSRGREFAVRSAVGAGQGRLVRQLLTESLVLSLLSTGAGVALAYGLIVVLVSYGPVDIPRLEQARIDATVLMFAVLTAVAASVLFGLAPAWRASRADVYTTLKEAGRGAGARGTSDVVRSSLIALEVAIALVLLVGAGLLDPHRHRDAADASGFRSVVAVHGTHTAA